MLTISNLATAYRSGLSSPTAVAQTVLAQIERSTLNIYLSLNSDLIAQAQHAEEQLKTQANPSLLCGIPVAVKDLIEVAGLPCTMGSEQYAFYRPTEDAIVIQRLRKLGALIVGKVHTHEFAYGSSGDTSHFGAALNPRDSQRMTGGSSSGSAAALAAGLAAATIGSDTSASIRLPAALCGVVGLKPTLGLLPKKGAFELSHTLDYLGPMSNTVADNAILLAALSGQDEQHYLPARKGNLQGLRIGLLQGFYADPLAPYTRSAIYEACQVLEQAGATIIPIDIQDIEDIYNAQQLILKTEAYARHRHSLEQDAPFQAEVRERLLTGAKVPAHEYIDALRFQATARHNFDQAFVQTDVLLSATCAVSAPPLFERQTWIENQSYATPWLLTRLTAPTNLSGHPSLSVPFGHAPDGLPLGIQLISPYHQEKLLYETAFTLEQAMVE